MISDNNRYARRKKMINSISEISQRLGMTKNEIKYTLKRNRKLIIAGAIVFVAIAVLGNTLFLGQLYGGISLKDFKFLSRLRFFRFLFG